MPKAVWNGNVLAESGETEIVESNHYFPPDSVNWDRMVPNPKQTTCPWKGVAEYFDVVVDGEVNPAAAWQYPDPKPAAAHIKDHVAFWGGVQVEA